MYNQFIFGLEIASAAVILLRSAQLGSHITLNDWRGHPLQFVSLSIAYPLLIGGAIGVLLNRQAGFVLVLIGVAFLILSDRRRQQ